MARSFASRGGRVVVLMALLIVLGAGVGLASVDNGAPAKGTAPRPEGPIVVGSGWNPFSWDSGGSPPPVAVTENPFTFTCTGACTLRITDCYVIGDRFSVSDNGTPIGNTSVPPDNGYYLGNPDQCFASPIFSHGTFYLAAGAHSIDLQVTSFASGFTSGGAAIAVLDGTVADPSREIPVLSGYGVAAMVLLLAGAGVAFILRMRHA